MVRKYDGERLKIWTPATYRIEVQGELNETCSDRLGSMGITFRRRKDQTTVTVLTGRVRDQAELAGILNTLYELHLPILSVENVADENGARKGRQDPDESSPSGP